MTRRALFPILPFGLLHCEPIADMSGGLSLPGQRHDRGETGIGRKMEFEDDGDGRETQLIGSSVHAPRGPAGKCADLIESIGS